MSVNTDIRLLVKVALLTVFEFSHRSEETWRAGRLTSLSSHTVEHRTSEVGSAVLSMGRRAPERNVLAHAPGGGRSDLIGADPDCARS